MNGHGTALQRVVVAGAVAGVLWGVGAAGPPLAQGGPVRPAQAAPAKLMRRAPVRRTAVRLASPLAGALAPAPIASASIVGGSDASITEFPFQVALYNPRLGGPAKGFFCGGVILDATRVATAAHCLIGEHGQPSVPAEIEVLAGSSELEPQTPGSVRDPVAATAIDPAYDPATSDYDVGVLSLARALWSGPTRALDGRSAIAPLAPDPGLAELDSAASPAGQAPALATVSGWGDLNAEPGAAPSYPLRLHKARVPLASTGFCEEAYATIEQAITPRMLCAGGAPSAGQGRTDSCYGDSGGPLVGDEAGASQPAGDVLLGLVDFGNGCSQAGYPGVYVRMADPAVARFLRASTAQASAGGVRRGGCARTLRGGRPAHGGRRGRGHGHTRGNRRCRP
jgi:secreted trypsin-like serine protease